MTAEAQLDRILHIIPRAAGHGGATYEELAAELGVDRDRIVDDLVRVRSREYYHPAETGTEIQVGMDGDRVTVFTTGPLQRPVRLTLREAAALHLGLRLLAAERDDPALLDAVADLGRRIAWAVPADLDSLIAGGPGACDTLRAALVDAARTRRTVVIRYLKPDAPGPETRTVDPWVVAHAAGRWYVVGRDHHRHEPRVFRVDRVLDVRRAGGESDAGGSDAGGPGRPGEADQPGQAPGSFTVPDDFDPADYLDQDQGQVYRADDDIEVTVRYGPRVARWLLERGEGEADDDGGVVVAHTVADPGWIVRHVLQYGPDAEVLAPAEVRAWVAEAVGRVER